MARQSLFSSHKGTPSKLATEEALKVKRDMLCNQTQIHIANDSKGSVFVFTFK